MDLKRMLDEQAKLDKLILERAGIKEYPANEVKLALLVELGELANEVQSFKYWKQNKNIDRQKVLEEFADCLHFTLSLENHFRYLDKQDLEQLNKTINNTSVEDLKAFYNTVKNFNLNAKFLTIYKSIVRDSKYTLRKIIKLGLALEISPSEMEEWYYKKHEKNIKRQQTGY